MTIRPQSTAVLLRRAARTRSRVVFFLLRRSLRRLKSGTKARVISWIERVGILLPWAKSQERTRSSASAAS